MVKKKEEKKKYSTLDQIVNALLKKGKLDDNKYQELQNSIKIITTSNVNNIVRGYLDRCLVIKQDVDNLLKSVDKANISDAIEKFRKEISLVDSQIKEINLSQINLGIKVETTKVRNQINDIKENFKSNIERLKKKLDEKENEINEESQQEVSSSSEQSSAERRRERDEIRLQRRLQKEAERDEIKSQQRLQKRELRKKKETKRQEEDRKSREEKSQELAEISFYKLKHIKLGVVNAIIII